MLKTAEISACGAYRYRLDRDWTQPACAGRTLLFVMLNPSVADAQKDDPTIRRCIGFAKAHEFTALTVVNLFSYRATSPRDLRDAGWPGASDVDDLAITAAARAADGICLAWGEFASRTPRAGKVIRLLREATPLRLQCLDTTADGHSCHPLRLPASLRLRPFPLG